MSSACERRQSMRSSFLLLSAFPASGPPFFNNSTLFSFKKPLPFCPWFEWS